MITFDMTIAEAILVLKDINAGIAKLTARNDKGEPVFAAILLRGEGVQEVIDAIEKVEVSWDAKTNANQQKEKE